MTVETLDEIGQRLGVQRTAIEGVDVLMLPENLASDDHLLDTDETIILAKYLKANGANCKTAYELGARPKMIDRRGGELWLGTIVFLTTVGANVASNLISDWLKARLQWSFHAFCCSRTFQFLETRKADVSLTRKSFILTFPTL